MIDDQTKQKIKDDYIKGQSIQGLANHYRVSVEDVLVIIDQQEMLYVATQGDMIDENEAGNAPLNHGTTHKIKYDAS